MQLVVAVSSVCSSLVNSLEHSQAIHINITSIAVNIVRYSVGVRRKLYHAVTAAVDLKLLVDVTTGTMAADRVM